MSPWRTLQCLQPGAVEPRARERQHVERQIEAEAALDSSANSSSMRPVPVPRSSSERIGLSASAARIAVFDGGVGDVQLADAVPFGGVAAEIILRGGGARGRAPRRAARGRARWPDRRDRAARCSARAMSATPPRSARRKNAHEPSRKRSTRPASASSRRWRERRGCDWRKISVRSETVSSASASSVRMRSRVASPAALSAAVSAGKLSWAAS